MCNLYKARSSPEELARLFGALPDPADQIAVERIMSLRANQVTSCGNRNPNAFCRR